jgi:two-component system sensor kinase FixL
MLEDKKSIKILIVDDSEIDLDILEEVLMGLGFSNVIKTMDGLDAFQLAKKHQPDLIISDIMMPELDGGELVEKLRENSVTKGIPVIFASSILSKKEEKMLGGQLVGGELLIAKPFEADAISAAIDRSLK